MNAQRIIIESQNNGSSSRTLMSDNNNNNDDPSALLESANRGITVARNLRRAKRRLLLEFASQSPDEDLSSSMTRRDSLAGDSLADMTMAFSSADRSSSALFTSWTTMPDDMTSSGSSLPDDSDYELDDISTARQVRSMKLHQLLRLKRKPRKTKKTPSHYA